MGRTSRRVSEVDASNNAAVAGLKELGIASKTFAHAVAMTVEEQASAVGSPWRTYPQSAL